MSAPITVAQLLDPLLDLLVLFAIVLVLFSRIGGRRLALRARRRFRRLLGMAWLTWGILWLFSLPRFSFWALSLVEAPPADIVSALGETPEDRCVMIVLTGGVSTPQEGTWPMEALEGSSLGRAMGAARLFRERPVGHVIVTGRAEPWGFADVTAPAIADLMVALGVPRERILIEPLARNTRENMLFSLALARALQAEKILVVTSAFHIPRAIAEAAPYRIPLIAAPVDHGYEPPTGVGPYVPSIQALDRTGRVVHEILGRLKP